MKKTRNQICILLVNPRLETSRTKWLPLGLAYIAAVLGKDFDVSVIDANVERMDEEEIANAVKEKTPDIIGITAMTTEISKALKIAAVCKSILPDTTIVLGGPHPTVLPLGVINYSFIDIIVVGEGEYAMREIALAKQERMKSFKHILGIVYKEDGEIITTSPRSPIINLDQLPFPARHLFPPLKYYIPVTYRKLPAAGIFTSRGCPYHCTFCYHGIFGKKFRARSPENVLAEIELLKDKYRIREFHIADDTFNVDKERVKKICHLLIERKINIPWACAQGLRINLIDQEILNAMNEAGCYKICYGIESGNQGVLNNIKKGITLEEAENAVQMAKRAKLIVGGLFMIGNYGETEQTINETINFSKKLRLDYAVFSIATPYPGTKFYEQVLKKGKMLATNWNEFSRYSGAIFEWNNLSKKQIDALYQKAYRKYYSNFRYLWNELKNLRFENLQILSNGIRILKNVLRFKDSTA